MERVRSAKSSHFCSKESIGYFLASAPNSHFHTESVGPLPPRTEALRDAIGVTLAGYVKSYDLERVCAELGIIPDERNRGLVHTSKRVTVLQWLSNDPSEVLAIGERVLARYYDPQLEELIWKVQEKSVEFSQLARRSIVSALSAFPDPWGRLGAEGVVGEMFPLGTSLLKTVIPCSELKSIQAACEQLDLLNISERRFRGFIERLVDPNVRSEDEQKTYVTTLNPILRLCGWKLQVTSEDVGRTVYSMQRIDRGVRGHPKNIIFASQVKPDLRFVDAVNNDVEIVTHQDKVLIYDRPIPRSGLRWRNLQDWWADQHGLDPKNRDTKIHLYQRLCAALPRNSPPQKLFFDSYFKEYKDSFEDLPALLPEVWLHYDPLTIERRGRDALLRQRMDFLMLFSHTERVVLEVDGAQHYSDNGNANPSKYAEMVAADRELHLSGYHVYRFGGSELQGSKGEATVRRFFHDLFRRHGWE